MRQYFIHDGQQQFGPFTIEEIKNQNLFKNTSVWHDGLSDWTTAEKIPELIPLINTPPTFKNNISNTPPPVYSNQPLLESENPKKSIVKSLIIMACLIIAGIIGWLMYNNKMQAASLEEIKNQQLVQAVQVKLQQSQQQKIDSTVQKRELEKKQQEGEKVRKEAGIARKKKDSRQYWYKLIAVTNNHYKHSEMGGIFGLEVVVLNNTDYMLDEVTTSVTYIKANGDTWQTVEVPVYNIPTHTERRQGVPDVQRGTSVQIGINGIGSKEMNFCYTPGNWANNSEDPYFCK